MPRRTIYEDESGKKYYKVSLPIFLSTDMVQGLAKLSNRSEQNIIQKILGWVSHAAELVIGTGFVEEDQKAFFINDDNQLEASCPQHTYSEDGDKVITTDHHKAGKSWTITEHLEFTK
tara:strand:- start:465 stop:818 length:354 start_codon:yes stop_codon:yes gene_type:complete